MCNEVESSPQFCKTQKNRELCTGLFPDGVSLKMPEPAQHHYPSFFTPELHRGL